MRPGLDAVQRRPHLAFGNLGVVRSLRPKPIAARQTEEPTEPQVGLRGNRPLAGNDGADSLSRDIHFLCRSVLAQAHGFQELLQQDLAWGNRITLRHECPHQ